MTSRIEELEKRIAQLELVCSTLAARVATHVETAMQVNPVGRNCDAASDARGMIFDMHKELDDILFANLGVRFDIKSVRRAIKPLVPIHTNGHAKAAAMPVPVVLA